MNKLVDAKKTEQKQIEDTRKKNTASKYTPKSKFNKYKK